MSALNHLPPDDVERRALHNEIHARPSARIRLPALVTYIAVSNAGITKQVELEHLRRLSGHEALSSAELEGHFVRLRGTGYTLKWERHSEFTRYVLVQNLPSAAQGVTACAPDLLTDLVLPPSWLAGIPGQTLVAIQLAMVAADLEQPRDLMARGHRWFGDHALLASRIGEGHSWVITDFRLNTDGFERMLVLCDPTMSPTRAGRLSQRLFEAETYRVLAMRGLPVAKQLAPMLGEAEQELSEITHRLQSKQGSDQELLDTLVSLAARVEFAIARHSYRFAASHAYNDLVQQRLAELREVPLSGSQTLGQYLQKRLVPAMATVVASQGRLVALSERIARAGDLLRTRVDIATEEQNRILLEKLTKGQSLQLRLQTTVEGLSIAAIAYYMVSLVLYAGKAMKATGWISINPEILAGAAMPLIVFGLWRAMQRVHAKFHTPP